MQDVSVTIARGSICTAVFPSLGVAKAWERPIEQPQGRRPWHAQITKIARNMGY